MTDADITAGADEDADNQPRTRDELGKVRNARLVSNNLDTRLGFGIVQCANGSDDPKHPRGDLFQPSPAAARPRDQAWRRAGEA